MSPEIKRKALHLTAGAVPLLLIPTTWEYALGPLCIFTGLNVLLDIYRQRFPFLARTYAYFFANILREHEKKTGLTGSTYFFLSLTFAYVLFVLVLTVPVRYLAVIYTGFMAGDAAAALIGTSFGRIRLLGSKTLEGTLAFVAASWIATFWILPQAVHLVFLASTLLALSELILVTIDDNCFAPLIVFSIFYILGFTG
jgi:dolichol kinase